MLPNTVTPPIGWSSDYNAEIQTFGWTQGKGSPLADGYELLVLTDDTGDRPPSDPTAPCYLGFYVLTSDGWETKWINEHDNLESALRTIPGVQ